LTIISFGRTFKKLTYFSFARRQSLRIPQPASDPSATREASSRASRCQRIGTIAVIAVLVCAGVTSCTRTQVGLSAAAIAAVIVGTTVGVTLAVQNEHHTLHGCVFSGPGGLELRTSDAKIYALEGNAATIKVGDRLKLHGSKLKDTKNSTGDRVFVVEKLSKDYGSCPAAFAAPAAPAR
jgi:hypothetical protein